MSRGRIWGSMVAVMVLVLIFDLASHMWGPGIHDWSTLHHTWNTVESVQGWLRLVGLPLTAFLLYLERTGNPLGKYWVIYPFARLLYDVGWMVYFGNPYPSWYVNDFGAFFLCMAPAFVVDSWGTQELRKQWAAASAKSASDSKIKLAIQIVSLITAIVGLVASLAK
jgi:hypothetical protein